MWLEDSRCFGLITGQGKGSEIQGWKTFRDRHAEKRFSGGRLCFVFPTSWDIKIVDTFAELRKGVLVSSFCSPPKCMFEIE